MPLFVGTHNRLDTRMCCVDLLVVYAGRVRIIVEIEESGFHPTKICGKFLQAALATHFIHESRSEKSVPYAEKVLFVHVLDGLKCLKGGGRKAAQAELIENEIRALLPLKPGSISDYHLLFVSGELDQPGLTRVASLVSAAL